MNKEIRDIIIEQCLTRIDDTAKGKELLDIRESLTKSVYAAWGVSRGTDFENLINQTITLYGETMLRYGLAIGRHPETLLESIDSLPTESSEDDGETKPYFNMIEDSARHKSQKSPEWVAWEAEYRKLDAKIEKRYPSIGNEFFMVLWGGITLMSEQMFRAGWTLRDNPNGLFNLPEPEVW